ncbi:unnamed protein product [Orchesella dallaii]|uniref:SHSP domain-containing protein n=1 Tax=Orchesella dallaii TaxID=48710 RepID=A0ABP1R9K2_9HEXA
MSKLELVSLCFLVVAAICETEAQFHPKVFGTDVVIANYVSLPSQLKSTVIPLSYTIKMMMRPSLDAPIPGMKRGTLPSEVTITVESIRNGSSNVIVMNQKNLIIHQYRVTVTNLRTGRNMSIVEQRFEIRNEDELLLFESGQDLYFIELKETFQFGDRMQIYIPYSVPISQSSSIGMFERLVFHTDTTTSETSVSYLAATKLWPYHAKLVFPVFDDPSLKATFKIIIGRLDGNYRSLSNMEIAKTEPDLEHDGWVWDHYEESVKMSPYLVCMVVCSGYANETVQLIGNGTRSATVWAPNQDIAQGSTSFGIQTMARAVEYYEKRFKMNYPLNKLDAIVVDRYASATENFGLVAFNPIYFSWTPGKNSEAQRKTVAQTIIHETVHQWYGNIVTCASWEDVWLNEGFARYLQFWGMKEIIPEFEPDEEFVTFVTQPALKLEQQNRGIALKNHASYIPFLIYRKGASLLKMMEGFLTRDVFESGLVDVYLQKMKWNSAYQDEFFEAMQEAVEMHNATQLLPPGTSLKEIMSGWTLTNGFPFVRVNSIDEHTIQMSQEKFTTWPLKLEEYDKGSWWIPLKIVSANSSNSAEEIILNTWLPYNTSTLNYSSSNIDTTKLLMVNPDASGYYRVLYDEKLSNLIAKQLLANHSVISSSSRSQLLDDYFNFAFANYLPIETALEMTRYLGKETSSNVWNGVLPHIWSIFNIFTQNGTAFTAFKNYFLPRLEEALGLIEVRQPEGQIGINVTLRAQLLNLACQLEMPACLEYASELMTLWQANPGNNPFPLDIQGLLYCAAVAAGGSAEEKSFDFIRQRYITNDLETTEDELNNLATALACTNNVANLKWLLKASYEELKLHGQPILTRLATNPTANILIHKFAKGLSDYWNESGNRTEQSRTKMFYEVIENKFHPFFDDEEDDSVFGDMDPLLDVSPFPVPIGFFNFHSRPRPRLGKRQRHKKQSPRQLTLKCCNCDCQKEKVPESKASSSTNLQAKKRQSHHTDIVPAPKKTKFEIKLNIDDRYKPGELQVKLDNNSRSLIVEGSHHEKQNDGNSYSEISTQLYHKFSLPKDVDMDKLKCDLDEEGYIVISAPRRLLEFQERNETLIPITHINRSKSTQPTEDDGTNKSVEEDELDLKVVD